MQDNLKLALRIQKSKKAIQRLRIERSCVPALFSFPTFPPRALTPGNCPLHAFIVSRIVYDRLQSTTTPTNPYSLNSTTVANAVVAPGAASAAAPTSLAEVQAKRGVEGVHGEEPRVGVVGESTVGNGLGEVKREVGAEGMEVDR